MNPVDRGYTLKPSLDTSLRKHGDRPAVRTENESLTYRELNQNANAIANGMADLGLELEDSVAVLMENRTEFVTSRVAIIKAGGALVPLNHYLSDDEIRHMLELSEARGIVCGPKFIDTIDRLAPNLEHLDSCIGIAGNGTPLPNRFHDFATLSHDYDRSTGPDIGPDPGDVASISFTGGTTGRPKGVVHTQRSRMMNMYAECIELEITGTDTMSLVTPLAHAARLFLVAGLLSGATILVRQSFDPKNFLRDIEEFEVTWTFCVPTMIYRLLDSGHLSEYDVSSLRTLVYGAAPMAPDRLKEALAEFGAIFLQLYGQTEVPNLITTLSKRDHELAIEDDEQKRLRSTGKPCMMTEIRIVDLETGDAVEAGEIGEITVTAPYIMREYHEQPDQTDQTLHDGWIHTGDIGKQTDNGYIYLLDRKDNVIVTGGMNVYSKEVENAIIAHPAVRDCAVIGVPHDDWGEAVKAFVVPYPQDSLDTDDLREFLDQSIADYKKPKVVEFAQELPRTPYGKINKPELE